MVIRNKMYVLTYKSWNTRVVKKDLKGQPLLYLNRIVAQEAANKHNKAAGYNKYSVNLADIEGEEWLA